MRKISTQNKTGAYPNYADSLSRFERLGFFARFIAKNRPFICPFHILCDYIAPKSRVLDIGCGRGLWLYLLYSLGKISSAVGIDINASHIQTANLLKQPDEPLSFYLSSGYDCKNDDFDCITLIDVLHHVPPAEQEQFIKELKAVNAGLIVFKDINPEFGVRRLWNSLHDILLSRQVPKYQSPENVSNWLKEIGFEITTTEKVNMLLYSHYIIVAKRKP